MPYQKTIKMTVDKFIKIKGNPAQRDTAHHAKNALQNHLKVYHPSHQKVDIAILNGCEFKLDGHTRSYLWENGSLERPELLYVSIWKVNSKQELVELYGTFDNHLATESVPDRVSGALCFLGINNANKSFVRNSGIQAAITIINRAMSKAKPKNTVIENLAPYKKELTVLINQQWLSSPSLLARRPGMPSCTIAAFLILNKLYGNDCLGFWDGYYTGKGAELFKSGRDGSLAAAQWIITAREKKEVLINYSPKNIIAILTAYKYYWDKKIVKNLNVLYKKDFKKSPSMQLGDILKELNYE